MKLVANAISDTEILLGTYMVSIVLTSATNFFKPTCIKFVLFPSYWNLPPTLVEFIFLILSIAGRKIYGLTWALQYINLFMINTGFIILAGQALKVFTKITTDTTFFFSNKHSSFHDSIVPYLLGPTVY